MALKYDMVLLSILYKTSIVINHSYIVIYLSPRFIVDKILKEKVNGEINDCIMLLDYKWNDRSILIVVGCFLYGT